MRDAGRRLRLLDVVVGGRGRRWAWWASSASSVGGAVDATVVAETVVGTTTTVELTGTPDVGEYEADVGV